MATGNTPRRKLCPQCEGSGVWGRHVSQNIFIRQYDCDVCSGKGIVSPYRWAKYHDSIGQKAEFADRVADRTDR